MAMIHINRDRKTLGKFNEQEVADGLKSGKFLPTDLAWRDPMPTWEPLSAFTGLPDASEVCSVDAENDANAENESAESVEPAWERTGGQSPVTTAVASVKQVLSTPSATFAQLPAEGGFIKPLFFYVLTAWTSGGAALAYQLMAALINPSMVFGEVAISTSMMVGIFVGLLFFLPVILIFGLYVSAGLFHLALLMTKGANKPFEATFRALAYAQGSASVLQFVPLCGGYIYPALSIVYSVIALREVHRVELWRVVLAAVLLFLLFCGLAMGAGLLFVGLGSAFIGAAK
jgi:hypothetical protein